MGFNEIRKLRKSEEENRKYLFTPYLILGGDLAAVLLFDQLIQKGIKKEEIKVIHYHDLDTESLYLPGASDLRGEENLHAMQTVMRDCDFIPEPESCFYKDNDFKLFSGRSKPMTLLEGEEYFSNASYSYDLGKIVPGAEILAQMQSCQSRHFIKKIRKTIPKEFLQKTYWEVECGDDCVYQCEHLFCSNTGFRFLELLEAKDKFTDEFHQMCSNARGRNAVVLKLKIASNIDFPKGTVYVPQSMTHEWGHFVGNFIREESVGSYAANFLTFLRGDEALIADEAGEKIRLLKRVLTRIFDKLSKSDLQESIFLRNDYPMDNYDDSAFQVCNQRRDETGEMKNLHLIGANAPLGHDYLVSLGLADPRLKQICFLSRILLTVNQAIASWEASNISEGT